MEFMSIKGDGLVKSPSAAPQLLRALSRETRGRGTLGVPDIGREIPPKAGAPTIGTIVPVTFYETIKHKQQ
jgi:hypothetical protein